MPILQSKRITLKDIASELGVSKSTVAKVLGNQPESRVSKEVAHQVRKTANIMGYQPSYAGQALRTGRTNLIGLIVPRISITAYPGFYHSMYMGVVEMTSESDNAIVQLLIQPRKKLEDIVKRGLLDGILFITSDPENADVDYLAETGLPLVVINREVNHRGDVSYITPEYQKAAGEAVRELVQAGHRRLALVAIGGKIDSNQRMIKGFQDQVRNLASQGVSGVWFDISEGKLECYFDTARQVVEKGPFDAYIVDIARQAEVLGQMIKEKTGRIIGQNKDLIVFSPEENTVMTEVTPWRLYLHQNELMGQTAYNILQSQIETGERKPQQSYVPFRIVTGD